MFKLVVLFSAAALAAAVPSGLSQLALSSVHPAQLTIAQQASSVVHPSPGLIAVPAVHSAAHIAPLGAVAHAPLGLWPHSPAVVLNAHGVPLDTPDVVAARALHLQAKALAVHGLHQLKKRSLVGPLGHGAVLPLSAQLISSHGALSPLLHSAPLLHPVPLHSGIRAW